MKKLSNLKLKKFHEMSTSEMKNVIGGYDGSFYGVEKPCTTDGACFGFCSVRIPGHLLPVNGTCQRSYALFPYYVGCACVIE